jgi:hypothetical protein
MEEPRAILNYGTRADSERTRRRWRLLWRVVLAAALLIVATIVVISLEVNGFVKRQQAAVEKARQHIPLIQAQTNGDSRFSNIQYAPFTAQNGSLLISGEVPDRQALTALKQVVLGTSPPVPVVWSVDVVPLASGPTTIPTTRPVDIAQPSASR